MHAVWLCSPGGWERAPEEYKEYPPEERGQHLHQRPHLVGHW